MTNRIDLTYYTVADGEGKRRRRTRRSVLPKGRGECGHDFPAHRRQLRRSTVPTTRTHRLLTPALACVAAGPSTPGRPHDAGTRAERFLRASSVSAFSLLELPLPFHAAKWMASRISSETRTWRQDGSEGRVPGRSVRGSVATHVSAATSGGLDPPRRCSASGSQWQCEHVIALCPAHHDSQLAKANRHVREFTYCRAGIARRLVARPPHVTYRARGSFRSQGVARPGARRPDRFAAAPSRLRICGRGEQPRAILRLQRLRAESTATGRSTRLSFRAIAAEGQYDTFPEGLFCSREDAL